jgi:hypothetical protein
VRARIAVPLLTACAILAAAVSFQAYRHRQRPDDPDWLLQRADEQAWLNDWINAAPVYHKAELLYQQRNEPAKALYAHVSQMMATSEMSSFAPQIASLTDDLQLPAARDPETRLRILSIRGMLETNYDAGLATKTWTEVGELARQLHHLMLASRAMGEEGIRCRRSRFLNKRRATTDPVSRNERPMWPWDRHFFNNCLETYPPTRATTRSFWCRMANCTYYPSAR